MKDQMKSFAFIVMLGILYMKSGVAQTTSQQFLDSIHGSSGTCDFSRDLYESEYQSANASNGTNGTNVSFFTTRFTRFLPGKFTSTKKIEFESRLDWSNFIKSTKNSIKSKLPPSEECKVRYNISNSSSDINSEGELVITNQASFELWKCVSADLPCLKPEEDFICREEARTELGRIETQFRTIVNPVFNAETDGEDPDVEVRVHRGDVHAKGFLADFVNIASLGLIKNELNRGLTEMANSMMPAEQVILLEERSDFVVDGQLHFDKYNFANIQGRKFLQFQMFVRYKKDAACDLYKDLDREIRARKTSNYGVTRVKKQN
jgi:hypothetical protein